MRDLTQQEIDDKPEWATHYCIGDFTDNDRICYEGNIPVADYCYQYVGGIIVGGNNGITEDAKPIPRKEFDITTYDYSHGGLTLHSVDDVNGDLYLSHYGEVHRRTRKDTIAEAKHFKLTAEDLRC